MLDEQRMIGVFRKVLQETLGEQASQELAVDYETAGKRLGVSERTIRRMVSLNTILTVKVGSSPRIPVSELRRITTVTPPRSPTPSSMGEVKRVGGAPKRKKRVTPSMGEAASIRDMVNARKLARRQR